MEERVRRDEEGETAVAWRDQGGNGGNILAEGLGPWASYVGAKVSEQGRGPVWFVVLMNSDLC